MISAKNISKSYKSVRALSGFSYDFERGIYAILGPNGSGKSTLMNIMTGNLKADGGTVTVGEGGEMPDYMFGYCPQYPGMYPNFTTYEMLDYIGILKNAENREKQIERFIEIFELGEYKNKRVGALSGGTKQRLAIAQAFMGAPELVILDEPTAGLDPLQRINVKNFLAEQGKKTAIIVSTHIVSDVENIAHEVIMLKKGKITLGGKLGDMLSRVDGKCFTASTEHISRNFEGVYRLCGADMRIVADKLPFEGAVPVAPELEDLYLSVFGMGDDI
ncbi:MAG: ATP-binding cassette domain-containing protein [Clostridia bacterium]|nr:ATP-binding cassette domain-containing protein [Clostridia bacterium]